MTYAQAIFKYNQIKAQYDAAVAAGEEQKVITRLSGRVVASLEAAKRAAIRESNPALGAINTRLKAALATHKGHIQKMDIQNRSGGYSIVKELSLGVKDLINSIKMRGAATNATEKKQANDAIKKSVGKNLKNVIKAPIALTTKILKSSIVATVLFAPISLGMGILHAAWTCMDDTKSPYEGKTVAKMSSGFTSFMSKLNSKVQSI
jgi:hypothetical protein